MLSYLWMFVIFSQSSLKCKYLNTHITFRKYKMLSYMRMFHMFSQSLSKCKNVSTHITFESLSYPQTFLTFSQ